MDKPRVPIFSAQPSNRKHVMEIQESLRKVGINSTKHVACPIKQRELVENDMERYLSKRVPILAVSRMTDCLSAMISYMTDNPVVSSRPDYLYPSELKTYFFSTLGTPKDVAVGSVLGPTQTANYIQRIFTMIEKAPVDMTIPFIGEKNDYTDKFRSMLKEIGGGLKARQAVYDEIDDNMPVGVLFRHRSEDGAIDRWYENTDSPVIITPGDRNLSKIQSTAQGTFNRQYHPEAAMVMGPRNAALFAAKLVGLYNDDVRDAVGRYSKQHSYV
ncbi:MAG: hypothetical protein JXC85_03520 [Candidatus Aenigmarchaeota archaeon]|nr:hypothetical protein [Candidatus Aenigmarchaeota archaeon]